VWCFLFDGSCKEKKAVKPSYFLLILALALGCCTQAPTPTPVPIATWIAEGVPEDLVISYSSSGLAGAHSVTINADGTVSSTLMVFEGPGSLAANGISKISQDELK
jgi:hypothetical protein